MGSRFTCILNQEYHHSPYLTQTKKKTNMEDRREFSGFTPLLVIGIMILAANGFLCFLFYARKRLRRKPENVLFFSQACADLMNGVIIIPSIP